jgi:hypothetical protein
MNKSNTPNTIESVLPLSGQYSCKKDLRLNAWFVVAASFYVISLSLVLHHPEWSVPLKSGVALAPLVPGMLYVRSCVRFIRGLDELQRRIQLEAWLFAALGVVFVEMAINILNENGVPLRIFRQGLGLGTTFILMFALWIIGSAIANRRYK